MTPREEILRRALLHDQAATLSHQDGERHEAEARKLREEAALMEEPAMSFSPCRRFRRRYDRLFRKDPAAANVMLLLAELADEKGRVRFGNQDPAPEIARLMAARFTDPRAYQLPGGPRR